MVEEKKECSGSEESKGYVQSLGTCASICKGEASMFIFGTNDFGESRCNSDGCKCYCETSATEQGTCDIIDHTAYRLYKYISGESHTIYYEISLIRVSSFITYVDIEYV